MTATIGSSVFDKQNGEVLRPQVNAIPFHQANSAHVGIQRTSTRGPGFTLTLTRYDAYANVDTLRIAIEALNGSILTITDHHGVSFIGFVFAVSQARVIRTRKLARACGNRGGTPYNHAPGVEVVCQMTFYAVPA